MNRAPVAIFVYNRMDHLKKMMDLLEKNSLVTESELYIFSDGGKNEADTEKVKAVRQWIHEYEKRSQFKTVHIFEKEHNCGLANSIINGVSQIFEKHNKVIVLEDDLLVAKSFLKYMNEALDYYEKEKNIWSISGYTPNLEGLLTYEKDVYLNYRPYSWGWATWKNRWELVDWRVKNYKRERFNRNIRKKFMRGGNLMPSMLRAQMNGKVDSWYVRWAYEASKRDMLTVYPAKSLVQNIGLDGSGTHCESDMQKKYGSELKDAKIQFVFFVNDIEEELIEEFKKFHSMSIWDRVFLLLKRN